ncbi:hypothetical protein DSL72_000613 [Monilinia vaccinii-corymbosi]|uniref:Complex 1 LYR protein domain-containing protein n=1 Tax=Monilinia vaccinii-corymbosi TaxID=61207 RepID=A0A8A3P217_9HELO|nr:hypothetical protein DSL72_000613 [Monilinia vaccinii-corymbosi]
MSTVLTLKGEASQQARSLYRQLLRQGGQFAAYNFREYARRRTRDSFREHKDVQDERKIQELMQKGLKELQSLKRQTVVSQFFQLDRLVVEGGKSGKQSGKRNDIVRQKDTGAPSRRDPRCIALSSSVRNHNHKEASVTNARDNSHLPELGSGDQIGPFSSSPLASKALQVATNTATPTSEEAAVQNIKNSLPSPSHNINQSPTNINMPAYRTGGRRQNRTGYVDHDILEGIPVRQWRREFVTVAPQPPQENNASQSDIWASELPWGMPKDSHLLPQHSQDLLRAARSGRIYKRPAPMDEEEQDLEVTPDKPDKKEDETKDSGFTARAWKHIPGHQNASDMDFLAKRRKGLASAVSKPHPVPTVVQTTVRRTDAAGNEYLEKVIVPHGQTVVGEVVSQTTIPDPSAVEGAPFRRKGPMGKRGKRGPGRGRKKIMANSTPHITSEPAAQNGYAGASNLGADGIKIEGEVNTKPAKNLDTEMIDESNPASDDDDGDEGDQGDEDDDSLNVLNSPSRPHRGSFQDHPMSNMHDIPKLSSPDVAKGGTDNYGPKKSELERVKDEGKFGSPLKQIALTTSTVNTPTVSPTEATTQEPMYSAPGNTNISSVSIERINEEMLSVAEVSAPTELPPVPPHPTREHEEVSTALRAEKEEGEEMLLDILENAQVGAGISVRNESSAHAVPPSTQSPTKTLDTLPVEETSPQNITVPAVEEPPAVPNLATALSSPSIREEEQRVALISSASPVKTDEQPIASTSATAAEHKSAEPGASTKVPEHTTTPTESNEPGEPRAESTNPIIKDDDDDEFPDLLGGLERNLYGKSKPPAAPPAPAPAPAPIKVNRRNRRRY